MGGQERKLVKDFDKNNDGWLNADERKLAREELTKGGGGRGGSGGPVRDGSSGYFKEKQPFPSVESA